MKNKNIPSIRSNFKKLKLIHWFLITGTFFLVTAPSKATYQDSIILAYLTTMMTYIQTVYEQASYYAEMAMSYAAGVSESNSKKMATDTTVLGTTAATTALAQQRLDLEFGVVTPISFNGKTYNVGAVGSFACQGNDDDKTLKELTDAVFEADEVWTERRAELSDPTLTPDEKGDIMQEVLAEIDAKGGMKGFLGLDENISQSDARLFKEFMSMLWGTYVDEPATQKEGDEPGNFVYRFDKVSKEGAMNTISGVMNNSINNSIGVDSKLGYVSKNDSYVVASAIANSKERTSSTQFKTEKGINIDQIDMMARRLSMKVDMLESSRNQEKLLIVNLLAESKTLYGNLNK